MQNSSPDKLNYTHATMNNIAIIKKVIIIFSYYFPIFSKYLIKRKCAISVKIYRKEYAQHTTIQRDKFKRLQ